MLLFKFAAMDNKRQYNETICYISNRNYNALIAPLLLSCILLLLAYIITPQFTYIRHLGLLISLHLLIQFALTFRRTTIITNKKIVYTKALFTTKRKTINIDNTTITKIHQTQVGRFFSYGSLIVINKKTNSIIVLRNINKPSIVRDIVNYIATDSSKQGSNKALNQSKVRRHVNILLDLKEKRADGLLDNKEYLVLKKELLRTIEKQLQVVNYRYN